MRDRNFDKQPSGVRRNSGRKIIRSFATNIGVIKKQRSYLTVAINYHRRSLIIYSTKEHKRLGSTLNQLIKDDWTD